MEAGDLDLYFFTANEPRELFEQQSSLLGKPLMPARSALGYHQCRWNYMSEAEVLEVSQKFEDYKIPCDFIWLDIEYSNHKAYFTWNEERFPDPEGMVEKLWEKDRRLVTIIDPHIKRDSEYSIYLEHIERNLAVRTQAGEVYESWCWPGHSIWTDYFNPEASSYMSSLYWSKPEGYSRYIWTDPRVGIWNDMNEPACFNETEGTFPKSNLHANSLEHRLVHNLYGYMHTKSTYEGLKRRNQLADFKEEPLLLTRSFFAGSQKFGAVWSGDCTCSWQDLRGSIPLLMQKSTCAITFVGCDVPGFFKDPPSEELVVRWYQLGCFYPFFRAHAHEATQRREPWTFSERTCELIAKAIRLRYQLLPYM